MSPRRCGWLLLLSGLSALFCGGSDAAWLAATTVVWALAVAHPCDLRWHPAADGWTAYAAWALACAALSAEPWLGLGPAWRQATCVGALVLATSWFSNAHRRAWVVGLWSLAGLAAALRLGGAGAAGPVELIVAALGSVAGFYAGRLPKEGPKAWAPIAPAALGLAALWLGRGGLHLPADHWRAAWRLGLQHPLAGIGPGLFARGWIETAPAPSLLYGSAADASSAPLEAWSETGWAGLVLYAAAALRCLPRRLEGLEWEGRCAAGAAASLLVCSWFAGISRSPGLQLLFFTALAVSTPAWRALGNISEDSRPECRCRGAGETAGLPRVVEQRALWTLPRWAAALGLAVCLAAWAPRELARRAAARGRLETALAVAPREAALHERLARRALFAKPPRLGEALRRMLAASRNDPRNAVYLGQTADLFALAGEWDSVEQWSERALTLEPDFASARLLLAECRLRRGAKGAAALELSRAEGAAAAERAAARPAPPGSYREALQAWDAPRYERLRRELGIR